MGEGPKNVAMTEHPRGMTNPELVRDLRDLAASFEHLIDRTTTQLIGILSGSGHGTVGDPDPVPCHWRNGGPFTLASDSCVEAVLDHPSDGDDAAPTTRG